ncbi:MAG: M48 family metalloprotease [Myxococcaceae bacterium]
MKVERRPTSTATTNTSLGNRAGSPLVTSTGAHPMAVLLFGKRPPRLVDRRKFPKLRKALRKAEALKERIAEIAGQAPDEMSIALCEGGNASISRDGQIALGTELLERHQHDDDFLVAVLGHEIGHQPWTWPGVEAFSGLNRAQLNALFREEEAKADRFAGRVLAELTADPESVCRFLLQSEAFEGKKPADYYPAEVRAKMIKQSFTRRRRALQDALAHYPGLAARARDLR